MNLRCEICLAKHGWAQAISNIYIAVINGVDTLVCRKHNPWLKRAEAVYEPKAVGY